MHGEIIILLLTARVLDNKGSAAGNNSSFMRCTEVLMARDEAVYAYTSEDRLTVSGDKVAFCAVGR
jgi:hypothetical protein